MPRGKTTHSAQTMLGVIFLVSMLAGFGAVAYIDYEYSMNDMITQLYISDSDAEFPVNSFIVRPKPAYAPNYYWDVQNSLRCYDSSNNVHYQFNKTAVYQGNNSWVLNVNSTGLNHNQAFVFMEIPNMDDMIIDHVILNTTKNTDSDLLLTMTLASTEIGLWDYFNATDHQTTIFTNYGLGSDPHTYYDRNVSIPLNTALEIYDKAQEWPQHVLIMGISDLSSDGLGAFAWEFTVEVRGHAVSDWAISDSIFGAIAGATVLNFVVAIYMTDQIDLGGYTHLLPGKRRK